MSVGDVMGLHGDFFRLCDIRMITCPSVFVFGSSAVHPDVRVQLSPAQHQHGDPSHPEPDPRRSDTTAATQTGGGTYTQTTHNISTCVHAHTRVTSDDGAAEELHCDEFRRTGRFECHQ